MSALELSPTMVGQFTQRVFAIGGQYDVDPAGSSSVTNAYRTGMLATAYAFNYLSDVGSGISIMSGTKPSDVNSITSWAATSPNMLVTFGSRYSLLPGTIFSGNSVTLNSTYVAATQSGTATWFLGWTRNTENNNAFDQIVQAFIGTIGVTGSGADFEIPNTTVTAGIPYKLSNFVINFPTVW